MGARGAPDEQAAPRSAGRFKLSSAAADGSYMAVAKLPDLQALVIELAELERRETEISAHRAKLFDRLASFPNEFTHRQEGKVSAERRAIHGRVDELRAQVMPRLRRRD